MVTLTLDSKDPVADDEDDGESCQERVSHTYWLMVPILVNLTDVTLLLATAGRQRFVGRFRFPISISGAFAN